MGMRCGDGLLRGWFGRFRTHFGEWIVISSANVDVFVSVVEEGASYVRVMCEIWAVTMGKRVVQWLGGRGTVESLSHSKHA